MVELKENHCVHVSLLLGKVSPKHPPALLISCFCFDAALQDLYCWIPLLCHGKVVVKQIKDRKNLLKVEFNLLVCCTRVSCMCEKNMPLFIHSPTPLTTPDPVYDPNHIVPFLAFIGAFKRDGVLETFSSCSEIFLKGLC